MELIQDLRRETESSHRALEKELVKKIKAVRTRDDYVDLLHLMHGFYGAMESLLLGFMSEEPGLEFHKRRKAEWIAADIKSEGGTETERYCQDLPSIDSSTSALGALYVLEGSTLGGQIIAAMLKKQLSRDSDHGMSFFFGYGNETPLMWERFKSHLNKEFTVRQRGDILRAATDTFNSFFNWVQLYEFEKTDEIRR
ncbi:biliverdin-producing heme oxygenase [Chryseolinea sp. T2]|uniref:biliverdin-producing heme oxygenase n=1 Tax=Chryseolinea sp. T2 TaxID=3129255 RepID=UPI0030789D3A